MKRSHCWVVSVISLTGWLALAFAQARAADPKSKPKPLFAEARTLFLGGKYQEAAAQYAKSAEKEPVAAALGVARCLAARGKRDEARDAIVRIKQYEREPALLAELAFLAYERGELEAAGKHAAAAVKLKDDQVLARWIGAQLARDAGKLKQAEAELRWFIDYYNGRENADKPIDDPDELRWIGLASGEYARWKRDSDQFSFLVNDLRDQQLEIDANYWPAQFEAGRLFLEKYNELEAAQDLKAALAINPNAAEVYAALGQMAFGRYEFEEAGTMAARALELNPQLVEGHLLRADLLMANFKAVEAAEMLEKNAVPLNPVLEETLGRLAACYIVLDGLSPKDETGETRFGRLAGEVHKRNEHAGAFYFALASTLDSRRRFNEAVRFYQEAMRRMPQLVGPQGSLGMLQMRLGEEESGKKLLEESFDVDPFNVRISNMLKVVEVLDQYQTLRTEHFVIKYNEKHDKLLARYAARYLEEQYPELCRQFGYQVPQPSLFEIFSKAKNTNGHGWFSARLIGLPYLGTVGACAGKMVGIASPNESPYNWARVLKHEFIHVINLQQTGYNLPHWFAEGIATHNEGYPRPASWNELLSERLAKNQMFTLDNINLGFIRPKSGLDWQMAYCQSELYVEFMFATYGDEAVAKLLSAYSTNLDTPAALRKAFDVEPEAFQKDFLAYVTKLVAKLNARREPAELSLTELQKAHEADPKNPDLLARLAHAQLARKDYATARTLAKEALALRPKHQLASYVVARTYIVIGENELAVKLLEECLDQAAPQENVLALLASIKLKAEQFDEAAKLFELGLKVDPDNSRWIKGLAQVAVQTKNDKLAGEMLVRLAEQDADNFTVRKKLANLALEAKDYPRAIRWGRESLHINVMDSEIHLWLGQAHLGASESPAAIAEFEVALELKSDAHDARLGLAQAQLQAKQPEQARKSLEQLLKLSPDHPGAKTLLESLKKKQ